MLDFLLHFSLHYFSDPERIRKARFSSGHAGLFWLDASKIAEKTGQLHHVPPKNARTVTSCDEMFQARLARMAVEESESAALRHETQVQCPTKF